MIDSTQIINIEIFVVISVIVLKLFSREVLFMNRKDTRMD